MSAKAKGYEIANAWGPALTKAMLEGDLTDFQNLFISDEPVYTVLQDSETGQEIITSIGTASVNPEMTWETFQELSSQDLSAQNFAKIEAQCLGILGDRMILETGRFNKDGEVYLEAYSLLTITPEGKISMFESFADVQISSLTNEISSANAAAKSNAADEE